MSARKLILQKYDVNAQDAYGCTALHWACMVGSEPVARLLTESGAVINSVNKRGWTPLHFALRDGHVSIVRLLTTSKAGRSKMKVLTDSGMTPIHMISNELVAAALFDRTLLRARSCDLLILREIRLANVVDFRGRTPLHWMAIRGSLSAAKALLQSGSDWTLKDNDENTARDLGVRAGSDQVVALIDRYAADLVAECDRCGLLILEGEMATHQHSDLCRNHGILFDHSKFHWFPYNYRMRVKLLLLELRRRVQQEELLVPETLTIYEAHATVSWVNDLLRGVLQESELLEEMGGMSDPANALAHRAGRKGLSSVGTSAEREAVRTEFTRRGTFLPRAKDLDRRRATDDASDAGSRAEEDEDEEDEDEEDNPLSPNEWFRWPNINPGALDLMVENFRETLYLPPSGGISVVHDLGLRILSFV